MNNIVRHLFCLGSLILPWGIRSRLLRRFLGWTIAPGSYIGFSFVNCNRVELDSGARVGHFNVIKNLELLKLGNEAQIGNLNWISCAPASGNLFPHSPDRSTRLELKSHASITHRHLIDCSDEVKLGEFATVAGSGSQILTHGIDPRENKQIAKSVHIGAYCYVGSRVLILAGVSIASSVVVGAGAVVTRNLEHSESLYGGVPAERITSDLGHYAYFRRKSGVVR